MKNNSTLSLFKLALPLMIITSAFAANTDYVDTRLIIKFKPTIKTNN